MQQRPTLIAHRGWSARFPENSLPAIAAAIAAGADEVEVDLRVSGDGVTILCHDSTASRVSSLTGPVGTYSLEELASAGVKDTVGRALDGLGFPTLEQVTRLFASAIRFNFHVKDNDFPDSALTHLAEVCGVGNPGGHYLAGDRQVLGRANATCPELPRCLVSSPDEPIHAFLESAARLTCSRVQFFVGNCNADAVAEAKRMKLRTNYYYTDTVADALEIAGWGMDALLTNDIGLLISGWPR